MTVRELADAAYAKGFEWTVRGDGGLRPGLTIKVADDNTDDGVAA